MTDYTASEIAMDDFLDQLSTFDVSDRIEYMFSEQTTKEWRANPDIIISYLHDLDSMKDAERLAALFKQHFGDIIICQDMSINGRYKTLMDMINSEIRLNRSCEFGSPPLHLWLMKTALTEVGSKYSKDCTPEELEALLSIA